MNHNNYSHILNIKLFSIDTKNVVEKFSLLESIKSEFLRKNNTFRDIKLHWKKIKWAGINKFFDVGDLLLDSPLNSDEIILENVRTAILEIENELHKKGSLLENEKIIFKIVKPLVNKIPLADTIGYVDGFF